MQNKELTLEGLRAILDSEFGGVLSPGLHFVGEGAVCIRELRSFALGMTWGAGRGPIARASCTFNDWPWLSQEARVIACLPLGLLCGRKTRMGWAGAYLEGATLTLQPLLPPRPALVETQPRDNPSRIAHLFPEYASWSESHQHNHAFPIVQAAKMCAEDVSYMHSRLLGDAVLRIGIALFISAQTQARPWEDLSVQRALDAFHQLRGTA